jgi:hypothetical protein
VTGRKDSVNKWEKRIDDCKTVSDIRKLKGEYDTLFKDLICEYDTAVEEADDARSRQTAADEKINEASGGLDRFHCGRIYDDILSKAGELMFEDGGE